MTVYMISGYDTITGKQDIIDYIPAEDAETACEEYVRLNPSCEVNEILDEFEEVLEMEKKTIRIMVKDDTILVSYDYGEFVEIESNNPILAILTGICYPETHDIQIQEHRMERLPHQKKLSTDHPDEEA